MLRPGPSCLLSSGRTLNGPGWWVIQRRVQLCSGPPGELNSAAPAPAWSAKVIGRSGFDVKKWFDEHTCDWHPDLSSNYYDLLLPSFRADFDCTGSPTAGEELRAGNQADDGQRLVR